MKGKHGYIEIRWYFTLIVFLEFLAAAGVSVLLLWLLRHFFEISSETAVLLVVLMSCLLIGSGIAFFVNRRIFEPIRRVDAAMQQVSSGDFSVRLEQPSAIRDVENIRQSFNLMAQELGATEMLQLDFVSNVSHEFKTPINVIEGYATLLQDTAQAAPEQQEYIDKILLNTRRLSGLVGNVLLLSRLENQAIPNGRAEYRLDEQIRQSVMALETEWAAKEIEFDADMEEVRFCGNEGLLMHVWNNLIGNAVKFNSYGGLIRLKLNQADSEIRFAIEDEGPGIRLVDQKHIFDKFYQADSSREQEGNGLGLALVKRIVTVYGGEIFVENRKERGCRFTVTLPVQKTES